MSLEAVPVGKTGISIRWRREYDIVRDTHPQRFDWWTDHLGWRIVFRGGGCE